MFIVCLHCSGCGILLILTKDFLFCFFCPFWRYVDKTKKKQPLIVYQGLCSIKKRCPLWLCNIKFIPRETAQFSCGHRFFKKRRTFDWYKWKILYFCGQLFYCICCSQNIQTYSKVLDGLYIYDAVHFLYHWYWYATDTLTLHLPLPTERLALLAEKCQKMPVFPASWDWAR